MERRHFIRNATLSFAALPWVVSSSLRAVPMRDPLDRIGCTTVSFRNRFASTRSRNFTATEPDFELIDIPAIFVERLGVRNVELWSKHFPESTISFGEKMRAAARGAGAQIINIQLDEPPFALSDPNREMRAAAMIETQRWMDVAAACGAASLRANLGGKLGEPWDKLAAVDSFRRLAEYGEKIGVKILVENHGGASLIAENTTALLSEVDSP